MTNVEIEELRQDIDHLITATKEGKIAWSKINPTTFVWNIQMPRPARILIQQVMMNERVPINTLQPSNLPPGVTLRPTISRPTMMRAAKRYIFQVLENPTGLQKISVSTADVQAIEEKLEILYELASIGVSRSGLDFLKSILPT